MATLGDAGRIQGSADRVITDAWKVFDTAAANQNYRPSNQNQHHRSASRQRQRVEKLAGTKMESININALGGRPVLAARGRGSGGGLGQSPRITIPKKKSPSYAKPTAPRRGPGDRRVPVVRGA